jgi:hypothetical protein
VTDHETASSDDIIQVIEELYAVRKLIKSGQINTKNGNDQEYLATKMKGMSFAKFLFTNENAKDELADITQKIENRLKNEGESDINFHTQAKHARLTRLVRYHWSYAHSEGNLTVEIDEVIAKAIVQRQNFIDILKTTAVGSPPVFGLREGGDVMAKAIGPAYLKGYVYNKEYPITWTVDMFVVGLMYGMMKPDARAAFDDAIDNFGVLRHRTLGGLIETLKNLEKHASRNKEKSFFGQQWMFMVGMSRCSPFVYFLSVASLKKQLDVMASTKNKKMFSEQRLRHFGRTGKMEVNHSEDAVLVRSDAVGEGEITNGYVVEPGYKIPKTVLPVYRSSSEWGRQIGSKRGKWVVIGSEDFIKKSILEQDVPPPTRKDLSDIQRKVIKSRLIRYTNKEGMKKLRQDTTPAFLEYATNLKISGGAATGFEGVGYVVDGKKGKRPTKKFDVASEMSVSKLFLVVMGPLIKHDPELVLSEGRLLQANPESYGVTEADLTLPFGDLKELSRMWEELEASIPELRRNSVILLKAEERKARPIFSNPTFRQFLMAIIKSWIITMFDLPMPPAFTSARESEEMWQAIMNWTRMHISMIDSSTFDQMLDSIQQSNIWEMIHEVMEESPDRQTSNRWRMVLAALKVLIDDYKSKRIATVSWRLVQSNTKFSTRITVVNVPKGGFRVSQVAELSSNLRKWAGREGNVIILAYEDGDEDEAVVVSDGSGIPLYTIDGDLKANNSLESIMQDIERSDEIPGSVPFIVSMPRRGDKAERVRERFTTLYYQNEGDEFTIELEGLDSGSPFTSFLGSNVQAGEVVVSMFIICMVMGDVFPEFWQYMELYTQGDDVVGLPGGPPESKTQKFAWMFAAMLASVMGLNNKVKPESNPLNSPTEFLKKMMDSDASGGVRERMPRFAVKKGLLLRRAFGLGYAHYLGDDAPGAVEGSPKSADQLASIVSQWMEISSVGGNQKWLFDVFFAYVPKITNMSAVELASVMMTPRVQGGLGMWIPSEFIPAGAQPGMSYHGRVKKYVNVKLTTPLSGGLMRMRGAANAMGIQVPEKEIQTLTEEAYIDSTTLPGAEMEVTEPHVSKLRGTDLMLSRELVKVRDNPLSGQAWNVEPNAAAMATAVKVLNKADFSSSTDGGPLSANGLIFYTLGSAEYMSIDLHTGLRAEAAEHDLLVYRRDEVRWKGDTPPKSQRPVDLRYNIFKVTLSSAVRRWLSSYGLEHYWSRYSTELHDLSLEGRLYLRRSKGFIFPSRQPEYWGDRETIRPDLRSARFNVKMTSNQRRLLNYLIERKEWNVIETELMDVTERMKAQRARTRWGLRVYIDWLKGSLPVSTGTPISIVYSAEMVGYGYQYFSRDLFERIFNRRIDYNDVRVLALQAERATHRWLSFSRHKYKILA